jgi:uncharacterized membrane protein (DUF373 family)
VSTEPEGHARPQGRLSAATERVVHVSETIIVVASGLLVIVAVLIAAATLYALFVRGVFRGIGSVASISELQDAVQSVFAGVLLLILGLELLETLKNYFTKFQIRIEVILLVTLIAISRHIMLLDIEHTKGSVLIGAAALMLALAISLRLMRARRGSAAED